VPFGRLAGQAKFEPSDQAPGRHRWAASAVTAIEATMHPDRRKTGIIPSGYGPHAVPGAISRRRLLARMSASGLLGLGAMAGVPEWITPALAEGFCHDEAGPASDGPSADEPPMAKPLGAISRRVAWGAKLEAPGTADNGLIATIALEEPRFLVIGSGLKFGNLHPSSMRFEGRVDGRPFRTWDECDEIVRLAESFKIPVRGDCLVWNDWLPDWLKDVARRQGAGWRQDLQEHFDQHIESVFTHFGELERKAGHKIMRWCGPVNEPLDPWAASFGRPAWRKGVWLDTFGLAQDGVPAYIHRAFEVAKRQAGSDDISFFLNESNCDNDRFGPIMRPAMLGLVDALRRAGRKVDAIGLECHLMPQWMNDPRQPDWRPFVAFLKELSVRGLAIYLTELDVLDCSLRDMAERDRLVAAYMRSFVSAAIEVAEVSMVSNWDLSDKYSWLRSDDSPTATYPSLPRWANCVTRPPCPRPAPYDQEMRPKAARRALAEALASAR
jgi:endo-1,4-beta-xylanase